MNNQPVQLLNHQQYSGEAVNKLSLVLATSDICFKLYDIIKLKTKTGVFDYQVVKLKQRRTTYTDISLEKVNHK